MLSFQTVFPDTLELLKVLMQIPELANTRLVGGTSLALQYGHRRSVDLDFFGDITEDADNLTDSLKQFVENVTIDGQSKRIKAYFLNGVKVDVVNYSYDWIDGPVIESGFRLASPKDIAAMKVNAVIGRGTKKDFIDIFYLLKHFSFDDLLRFYLLKYPEGSEYRALLSMSYFADADLQPMPYMFDNIDWDTIKQNIKYEVAKYNKSLNAI